MKTRMMIVVGAVIFLGIAAPIFTQQPPENPLDELAWLVGGKWVAEIKTPKGDSMTVETTFEWSGHKKALKYAIAFKSKEATVPQYEGLYWWNPAKKALTLLQLDRQGNMTEAVLTVEKGKFFQKNTLTRPDGKTQEQRAQFERVNDDTFLFKAFVQKDDEWVEAVAFQYKRIRESTPKAK